MAAEKAGCSRPPSHQQRFPAPPWGPQGAPRHAGYVIPPVSPVSNPGPSLKLIDQCPFNCDESRKKVQQAALNWPNEDKKEIQAANASLATAKETGLHAAVAAVLADLNGIFISKKNKQRQWERYLHFIPNGL